jgi:excisionase family DNA binding protein
MGQRLALPEAAEYLGLAPRTLRRVKDKGGGIPYYKLGAKVVFDTDDLDAYLEAARVEMEATPSPSPPIARRRRAG